MRFLSLPALIKPSKTRHLRHLIALCVLFTPIHSLANDHFSSWSDKTICRLAKATPDNTEYQTESTKRGLSCGAAVAGTSSDSSNINLQTINPADRVVTSTDQRYQDICNAFESGTINELHDGIRRLNKKRDQRYSNIGIDVIADLYGDGKLDASSVHHSSTNKALNTQNIKFSSMDKSLNIDETLGLKFLNEQPTSKGIRKIISGDLNNDNMTDLVFIDYGEHDGDVKDGKVIMLLSSSEGYRWSVITTKAKIIRLHTGVLIDIDNDNDLDLVVGGVYRKKYPHLIHIFKNDGKGEFSYSKGPNGKGKIGDGWVSFTSSDIDNDGYHDLIMSSTKYAKKGQGVQIVWGGEYGLFTSLKITKMPYDHTNEKDILMDAITYDKSGKKNILFIYAADLYANGTKVVNYEFSGRKITASNLVLYRNFSKGSGNSAWVNTIYPCKSGLKYHTFSITASEAVDKMLLEEQPVIGKEPAAETVRITPEQELLDKEFAEFEAQLEEEAAVETVRITAEEDPLDKEFAEFEAQLEKDAAAETARITAEEEALDKEFAEFEAQLEEEAAAD